MLGSEYLGRERRVCAPAPGVCPRGQPASPLEESTMPNESPRQHPTGLSTDLNVAVRRLPRRALFILADDLGWADLGRYGSTTIRTPYRRPSGHRSSSVSSTAMPAHRGVHRRGSVSPRSVSPAGCRRAGEQPHDDGPRRTAFPADHPTLPSILAGAGYRTAMFGKLALRLAAAVTARYCIGFQTSSGPFSPTARWTTSSTSTHSVNPDPYEARPWSNRRATTRT